MQNKAVSLLFLSVLSMFILASCSSDTSDIKIKTTESHTVDSHSPKDQMKRARPSTVSATVDISSNGTATTLGISQAKSFLNIYSSTCAKYLSNLDEFRDKLEGSPKLPDEQAKPFLKGYAGSVWPIPDDHGLFVLSLIEELNMCAVYAREADLYTVQQQFTEMFSEAPHPLAATIRSSTQEKTASGERTTLEYVWTEPDTSTKMLFMLTTDSSVNVEVQALFTGTMIQE